MGNPLSVDKIICLCLDQRYLQWEQLAKECREKGYLFEEFIVGTEQNKQALDSLGKHLQYSMFDKEEFPPHYNLSTTYPTWWKRANAYSAFKSHREMMQKCLNEGLESVIFYEDDSVFAETYETALPMVEDFAAKNNWDMMYFGFYGKPGIGVMVNPIITKLNGDPAAGFYAVALKKHIMQKLVKFPAYGPYDWLAHQYLHPNFSCYGVTPAIIRQQGGYSYVEGHTLLRKKEDNYC